MTSGCILPPVSGAGTPSSLTQSHTGTVRNARRSIHNIYRLIVVNKTHTIYENESEALAQDD